MQVAYPHKNFAALSRETLAKLGPLRIRTSSGMRHYLVKKSIAMWPKKLSDLPNWATGNSWWYVLCMNFCPTLMVFHSAYSSAGYEMSYLLQDDAVDISYVLKG